MHLWAMRAQLTGHRTFLRFSYLSWYAWEGSELYFAAYVRSRGAAAALMFMPVLSVLIAAEAGAAGAAGSRSQGFCNAHAGGLVRVS